ncbi:MAG: hypothetical protein Q9217_006881 [Psora testacea]
MQDHKQEYGLTGQGQQGQLPQVQHQGTFSAAPGQQQYQTAIPLGNLTDAAAPVDCPICKQRALTRVEKHSGNTVHAWAALSCLCFCLGCVPYLVKGLKDVEHYCGHCGTRLAVWKNSGRTVVEAHA